MARARRSRRSGWWRWARMRLDATAVPARRRCCSVIERMRAVTDAAAGGDAQCRHAAQCGRAEHLPDLAGVHGKLCAQVCARGSELGGRMLRHDAGAHPRDAQRLARDGGAGCGREADARRVHPVGGRARLERTRGGADRRWRSGRASAECIAEGEFVTMVEIVPPKGFDCAKEIAGAALLAARGVTRSTCRTRRARVHG